MVTSCVATQPLHSHVSEGHALRVMAEHLFQENRSGEFRYRRRVPPELQGVAGKKLLDISLKADDPGTARGRMDKVYREIEAQ